MGSNDEDAWFSYVDGLEYFSNQLFEEWKGLNIPFKPKKYIDEFKQGFWKEFYVFNSIYLKPLYEVDIYSLTNYVTFRWCDQTVGCYFYEFDNKCCAHKDPLCWGATYEGYFLKGDDNHPNLDCEDKCCRVVCGDGVHVPGLEECDDGNWNNLDGCSSNCKLDCGWKCPI